MRLIRVGRLSTAIVVALATLTAVPVPKVFAAANNCTWTGATNNNFNTAGNWSNCGGVVPQAGDNLVFDSSSLSADQTLNNDITSLSVGSITFQGTNSNFYRYTVTGNAITVAGGIAFNYPGALNTDLTLGADQSITETNDGWGVIGDETNPGSHTLTTGGHALTFSGSDVCTAFDVESALAGSGALTVNMTGGGLVALDAASPSYSGNINVTAGLLAANDAQSLGDTTGTTSVASGGAVYFATSQDTTYAEPLSLAGTGIDQFTGTLNTGDAITNMCAGGGGTATTHTATLTGAVTLTSDVTYGGSQNLNITGTYTKNGHNLTVSAGAEGQITTPDGTQTAPPQTVTIAAGDNNSTTTVTVGNNQTYVIDGIRGATFVNAGGTLKGTGTIGFLTVADGGTVAPGHSPGCLNTADVSLSGTYQVEIGGTTACSGYDQLNVTGTVTLDDGAGDVGKLSVSPYGGFVPKVGESFTIINNDGNDAVTGTFQNLAEGATLVSNGVTYTVTYKGGDGNDVVLTVKSVAASATAKTPNTGFQLVGAHPAVVLATTMLTSFALVVLSTRLKPFKR